MKINGRWLAGAILVLAGAGPALGSPDGPLHVPSPDWRDQVIYFVLTDRFDDCDPANNDQHAGEFAAADPSRYNGGDFKGLSRRLDYIRGLGATALWVTPPVANLWWDKQANHGGYHGYWAEDFGAVDAHLGSLADYQRLSRQLHGAGMFLVQDIVLNHTGDWFEYGRDWNKDDPAAFFSLKPDSRGRTAPSQWPFSLNDARDPVHRAAGIYHWTPNVRDFRDPLQLHDFQMSGLDDLNSENPVVLKALRKSYGHWIREAGVDAFRVDTILYVPPASLVDFLFAEDKDDPGMEAVARQTGRRNFHVFGEGFAIDKPYEESQAQRIEALTRQQDGSALMPGMINFPLYGSLVDVFARGRPTAELGYRITSMMRVHARPELMPTFVDNHDVDRFLSGGDAAGLQQALLAMMTLPGIPTIYYGTEQGVTVPPAAMFAGGSDAGGRDHFDTDAPLYRFIQRATTLRREHRVFSRGKPTVLRDTGAGPGVFAYRMDDGKQKAIVVFNTSGAEALLDNLETGFPTGSRLRGIFDIAGGTPRDEVAGEGGRITLPLPPRSGRVWLLGDGIEKFAAPVASIALHPPAGNSVSDDFELRGEARGLRQFRLVVDGDLSSAMSVDVDADGRWKASVDTSRMVDPKVEHEVVGWHGETGVVSAPFHFRVNRQWRTLADVADPAGDDRGRALRYSYPNDESWSGRTTDIRRVRVEGAGGALRITLTMADISRSWNPPNGFDHAAFTIFIQLPGRRDGARAMPLQNAELPGDMRWNVRLRSHGWSNALHTADGASAGNEGRAATPSPGIEVDPEARTVSFTLSAAALGGLDSLAGAKILVSTWDFDGGFRPLSPEPGGASFGGGDGARDPLIMDESRIIQLH
ncbi:MAG: alpha-amylase family glycosyl hydrolase [Gammaproteobacteria bacterium]|nr:alpha-amylase family glycosyl hydrolase [Gammaproteobacteria bacterium]